MAASSDSMPPVPSHSPIIDIGNRNLFGTTWTQWFVQLKVKVDVINSRLVGFSSVPNPARGVDSFLTFDGSVWGYSPVTTGVTPGSYTSPDLTIGADGRIIAASNGSGGSAGYGTLLIDGGSLAVVSDDIIDGGQLPYRDVDIYDAGVI